MSENRPLFIVGTPQEAGAISELGHEAQSTHDMDAQAVANLVLELREQERMALVMLNRDAGRAFTDACAEAGVPWHEVLLDGIEPSRDSSAFADLLAREENTALERLSASMDEAHVKELQRMCVYDSLSVLVELAAGEADSEPLSTGFKNIDTLTGGGLPMGGLTILGAFSGGGKTTLVKQVADNVCEAGRPTLFVSCEMNRYELTAMSLSRMIRQQRLLAGNGNTAETYLTASRGAIMRASARERWEPRLAEAFTNACGEYAAKVSPRMYVMEPLGAPTVASIRKAAEAIRRHTGLAPLVIVDYLQLLAPADEHMDERRAVSFNTLALRQIARDMNTAVLLISALNRASYGEGITMAAFRESSAIEYSSDLLLALEPQGMNERVTEARTNDQRKESRKAVDDWRDKEIKPCELRVLKNRTGNVKSTGAALVFEGKSCYFYAGVNEQGQAGAGWQAGAVRVR